MSLVKVGTFGIIADFDCYLHQRLARLVVKLSFVSHGLYLTFLTFKVCLVKVKKPLQKPCTINLALLNVGSKKIVIIHTYIHTYTLFTLEIYRVAVELIFEKIS